MIASGTNLGPYEILSPLGAGGMGEVYRARDPKLKRDVAIKVLPEALARDANALARFEREALAVAALSHPGILSIFDFGTHDGVAYAVMELLEGGTLRERLQAGPIPIAKAVALAREMAEGLAAAHDRGIVHRDLKPENLFVTRDGRLKILDFGLARWNETGGDDRTSAPTLKQTEPGTVMGTVGYMSPEQVRGVPVDHRSDVFSFGAVLYELLSGRRAFKKDTAAETMTAILHEEPGEIAAEGREVPPSLERITRRCLEKDPAQRFQSARDVAFSLDAVSDVSTTSRTKAAAAAVPLPPAGGRAGVAALVVATAVAATFLTHALWKTPAPAQPVFRQLTSKKGTILNARFGPDGKTVFYSASWDGSPTEVFTIAVDSEESKPVGIKNASLLAVASGGELLVSLRKSFLRSFTGRGTLARVAQDGGAPREVLEDAMGADYLPDGKSLAVLRADGVDTSIEMPIGKRLFGPSSDLVPTGDFRVSPDGSTVAIFERTGEGIALATIDASGRKTTRTRSYFTVGGIAWDRHGREVWFGAGIQGELSIQVVDLAGHERTALKLPLAAIVQDLAPDGRLLVELRRGRRDLQVLVPGEERERTLSWNGSSMPVDISADGRTVLFTERSNAITASWMFVRATDGTPAVRLGEGRPFALSPDGRFVLATVGTPPRLALVPTGAGPTKALDQGPLERIDRATFHPDGKSFLITGMEKGKRRIWRVGLSGPPVPVSPEGVSFHGRAVSPDGKWVVAFRDLGNFFLQSLEGQPERATAGDTSNTILLGWSEDGRWLYVAADGGLPGPIERFDPVTGKRELHRERTPPDLATLTSVQRGAITPDGRGHVYDCGWTTMSDLWVIEGLK